MFRTALWCMKVLALAGSNDAEGKGPQRKMSARHLSSSCFPSPRGHRSMQCMLEVWVVSVNEEILLGMLKYWAALELPWHRSSCHPSWDSALAQCLNDCALTTELHALGTLPHLRITKQLLSLIWMSLDIWRVSFQRAPSWAILQRYTPTFHCGLRPGLCAWLLAASCWAPDEISHECWLVSQSFQQPDRKRQMSNEIHSPSSKLLCLSERNRANLKRSAWVLYEHCLHGNLSFTS